MSLAHLTQGRWRRPRRRVLLALGLSLLLLGVLTGCTRKIDVDDAVHVLTADGVVNPVMARYVDRGFDEAERTHARAVVIRIDTPGGLDSSIRDIIQRINSSDEPVIT